MTKLTGITYEVDHIVPIAHGGLHIPENLQILTKQENMSKYTSVDGVRKEVLDASLRRIVEQYGQVLQKLSDFDKNL